MVSYALTYIYNGGINLGIDCCPCSKKKCPRRGDCAACREHHKTSRYLPACERNTLFEQKKKAR
nr:MAG: hypothetical protein DIU81_07150 [[Clostridium] cellulosi]